MSEEIEVKVHSYGPDRPLSLVWFDPVSGRKKAKSAKIRDWREAERMAAALEKELRAGRYVAPSKVTWQEFRQRYEAEKLAALSLAARKGAGSAFNHLERVLQPDRLCKLTTAAMSKFIATLRGEGMKESTLAAHLRQLRAALNWAKRMKLLAEVPTMDRPKPGKSKGRPITAEEFDRLLAEVPEVRPHDAADWVRYLTGLWLSGLRREESTILSWDEEAPFRVDLSGRRPAFRIEAAAQKARRDEVLPMTPDFAEWLLATFPEAERQGRVFRLRDKQGDPLTGQHVGEVVSKIGEKARVVVNKADGKFASAHDLRRAFGTRWAKRVMPAVLQRLMRHASIHTAMTYYVALDAADVADELWSRFGGQTGISAQPGNTSGNNGPCEEPETPVFAGALSNPGASPV